MLSDKEQMLAFVNNLSDWDWDLNPKFSVDENTGKALVRAYWDLIQKTNEGKSDERL